MGLGEVLVGNYPGRALSFAMKKATPAEAAAGRRTSRPARCPRCWASPANQRRCASRAAR